MCVSPVPIDHSDLVADLLKELSNHNERVEERKGALLELLKITREDSLGVWEEHFKTILLLLLETLGDKDVGIYTVPSTWWGYDAFLIRGDQLSFVGHVPGLHQFKYSSGSHRVPEHSLACCNSHISSHADPGLPVVSTQPMNHTPS